MRDPDGVVELADLPELMVPGLPDLDARALLGAAQRGPVDERVTDGSSRTRVATRWRCWSCRGG